MYVFLLCLAACLCWAGQHVGPFGQNLNQTPLEHLRTLQEIIGVITASTQASFWRHLSLGQALHSIGSVSFGACDGRNA